MRFSKAIFFGSTAPQSAAKENEHGVLLICLLFSQPKRLLRDVELLNHLPGNLVLTALWGRRLGATALMRLKWLQRDEMNVFFYLFRLSAVVEANECWPEILVFLRSSRKKLHLSDKRPSIKTAQLPPFRQQKQNKARLPGLTENGRRISVGLP